MFGIANIQAANRIKKTNNFLREIQKEKRLYGLNPIYNDYGLIAYQDTFGHYNSLSGTYIDFRYACIDIKRRKLIYIKDCFDNFIAKGGYVFQDVGYKAEYPDEIMGRIANINGETLLDSVTNWYLFRDHFFTHKTINNLFVFSLYKAGGLIRKDTIRDYDYCSPCGYNYAIPIDIFFVHNKYYWINGSLYDEKLNKVLADADWGNFEMAHHNYMEMYPKDLSFYTLSGDRMTLYNKRCKKKYTIPFETSRWNESSDFSEPASILWNKKLIVLNRRVYDFKGAPITPEKHYFSGYYNKFLIYNNNEETFVMTLDKTQFQQIKLGKCRLEKTEKKWLLRTPTSTDTLDNITGLNSDKHIGTSVGNKLGIINNNGETIIPPDYDIILIDKLYYIGIKLEYGFPYDLYDKKGKLLAKGMSKFIVDTQDTENRYYCGGVYDIYKPDVFQYFIFKEGENKYRYWLRNKKKSKVFYADEINTEDLSNRYLPIKKDGIWQYLEIK